MTFTVGVGDPELSPDDWEVPGRELVHYDAAVLAISDLRDHGGYWPARQLRGMQACGLVVGLHLAHQLGVAALGLDHRDDAGGVAARVCAHQPVRQMLRPSGCCAVCSWTSTH